MNLHRKITAGIAALLLTGVANLSLAGGMVSLDPDPALGTLGDSIFFDLVWDGTGTETEYLAGWNLDVGFDDTILAFVDAAFNPEGAMGFDIGGFVNFGSAVEIFDVSLSPTEDLEAAQDALGNVFVMATLEFSAVGVGNTDLVLTEYAFATPAGDRLADVMLVSGQACIGPAGTEPSCSPVPEPGILSLFGLTLLGLAIARRRPQI